MAMSSQRLGLLLEQEGLLPRNCSNVELRMPAHGAVTLHYDVFVNLEDIPKITRALAAIAQQEILQ